MAAQNKAAPQEQPKQQVYRVTRNAGPWLQGQVISEEDLRSSNFADKFLANGAVVSEEQDAANRTAETQAELNNIDQQMGTLLSRKAELMGVAPETISFALPEPGAPAIEPPTSGVPVIQPTSGQPALGTVVKGETGDGKPVTATQQATGPVQP